MKGDMEKLKGYLGLAVALALAALVLYPVPHQLYPAATRLTPLDATLLAQLATTGMSRRREWLFASHHINACPPAQPRQWYVTYTQYAESDCTASGFRLMDWALANERVLVVHEPGLPALLAEQAPLRVDESKALRVGLYQSWQAPPARNSRLVELELEIGGAIAGYLADERPGQVANLYVLHGGLLGLAFALGLWRRQVGAVLLSPFSLLRGGLSVTAKAAKGIHDKV